MSDPITPQTRTFAQEVLARAKQVQDDVVAAQLPPVPTDLARAGWAWQISDAGTARLCNEPDGMHTRYYPPTAAAASALDEARAIIAREAALVAAEDGVVTVVAAAFDYAALADTARIVVQQATKEIHDELDTMRRSAISIGRRLVEVKAALPHGGWGSWLRSEFGWSDQTATNYMRQAQLAAQNPKFLEFEDRIEPSARTLLAAPSTPEPAREEALRRAEAGETVRHRDAKEIVGAAKAAAAPAPSFDEAAPPLSTFDRHVLTKQGYTITERTRLREDDVWEYELQPPPTIHGKPAPIWATLRRIGAIISGMDRPPPPAAPQVRPLTDRELADLRTPAAPPTPAPAPEILDGVGRQPYGAKGAERWLPNVPHVLIVGERSGYYSPPVLIRAATIYDTPTTVRVKRPDGKEETQTQHKVWAVPDDAAWAAIETVNAEFATALAEYANVLRELGRYADQLNAAGGMKAAPNPLCATVARSEDPDHTHHSTWSLTAWFVPYLERKAVDRHTPKMLVKEQWGNFAQDDSFVLADDAAWERVSTAQQACKDAAKAAEQLLHRLGTYDEALDGRHQRKPAPAALSEAEIAALGEHPLCWHPAPRHDDPPLIAMRNGMAPALPPMRKTADEWRALLATEQARARAEAATSVPDDLAVPLARAGAGMRAAAAAQEAAALGGEPEIDILELRLIAAGERIIASLSEAECRILGILLCYPEEAERALTAPLIAVRAGFQRIIHSTAANAVRPEDAAQFQALLNQVESAAPHAPHAKAAD